MVSQRSMEGERMGGERVLPHHGRVVHHGMKLDFLHVVEPPVVVDEVEAHFHGQLLAQAFVEWAGALVPGGVGKAELQRPLAPLVSNPGLLVELGDALVLKERNRETSQKPKKRRSESEKQLRSQKKTYLDVVDEGHVPWNVLLQ